MGRPRKKVENRGGAREGSGRKPIDPTKKKKQTSFYISQAHADKYAILKDKGFNLAQFIEAEIDRLANTLGIE